MIFTLKHIVSFFKFWCSATNAHGVHSPFVYNLVTRCFYNNKNLTAINLLNPSLPNFKSAKLVAKVLNYFRFSEIQTNLKNDFNTQIALESSGMKLKNISSSSEIPKITFIFIDSIDQNIKNFITKLVSNSPEEFTILIRNIRQDKKTFNAWNSFKSDSRITISIDTYCHGFLIRRTGQVKEDFKIRL